MIFLILEKKKTNPIDEEIESINNSIKKVKKSNLSSFRIKQQLKNLNQRKQNLLNKKKDKEDDDLTIIY